MAPEIAHALNLSLDYGLVSQFAVLHDLVELRTADVATFIISESELRIKHEHEQIALVELLQELPPYSAYQLLCYERQELAEARFVKLIDKLLPIVVDIIGQGDRVMREDYDVHTRISLEDAHERLRSRISASFETEFPDIVLAHALLTRMYEDVFIEA